ncbi:MAG: nucleoside-diphosphate sugar epimerase/dehydratase [Gammaproteobacteria bacterium]
MLKIFHNIRSISRNRKILVVGLVDLVLAFICWVIFGPPLSVLLAANFEIKLIDIIWINYLNFLIPIIFTMSYLYFSGLTRSSIRFSDSRNLIIRSINGSFIFGLSWGLVYLFQYEIVRNQFLYTVLMRSVLLAFVYYASIQIVRDLARVLIYPKNSSINGKPVLIYGAGGAGNELYHSIKNNRDIYIVGFFDDSNALSGSEIDNIKIYGDEDEILNLKKDFPNLEIYLAIPSLSISERRRIISNLQKFKVAVRSIPSLHEIVANQKKMIEMQELSIDEILPRTIVRNSSVMMTGKTIMITGAGGSIGSELVRQLLQGDPKKLILFEISEINLYSIQSEIENIINSNNIDVEIISVLGDVKDKKRIIDILTRHEVNLIYHAAAYKHVPIVEYYENITEGIKNNIFGTKVICDAAVKCNVKKVVVISTDKAVRPTNIMGASKRLAEMVVQSADKESISTRFCMVRFGNVINSSGSVIPLFRKQISNGGPITITHKDVTRFFMTISEASSLVIQAGEFSDGGEVFILDMGEQVKIIDLAKKLVYLSGMSISDDNSDEGIQIKEVGLRPGEKLYEELLISGNELETPHKKIFKSIEKFIAKDELDRIIESLNEKVISNNIIEIKNILSEYVEGYVEATK